MKKYLQKGLNSLFAALILTLMLISTYEKSSAYCDFVAMYPYDSNIDLDFFSFDNKTVMKWDLPRDTDGNIIYYSYMEPTWESPVQRYFGIDSKNATISAEAGKTYSIKIVTGSYYAFYDDSNYFDEYTDAKPYYYPQDLKIYIDVNQNNEFDDDELLLDANDDSFKFEYTIEIPKTAKSGKTTMRVVNDYAYYDEFNSCSAYYGQAHDFSIQIEGATTDVGISQISAPSMPFTPGLQDVKAILNNYGGSTVTECTINWNIDGNPQSPYSWKGTLAKSSSVEVTLGSYNFVAKKPYTKYTISAASQKPNKEDDTNSGNDGSPTVILTTTLPPQTYTVGGSTYDFESMVQVGDIMQIAGLDPTGDYIFNIRPGTYTGQISMVNIPNGLNHKFIFQKDPNQSGEVKITNASTGSNYLWRIDNLNDVTLRNISFEITDPNSFGSRGIWLTGSSNGFVFEGNKVTAPVTTNQNWDKYTLLSAGTVTGGNHRINKNEFRGGAFAIDERDAANNGLRKGMQITKNKIENFSNRGVQAENMDDAVISGNSLKSTQKCAFGILVYDGTTITGNTISNLVGTSAGETALFIQHTNSTAPAIVTDNVVTGCTNMHGIRVIDANGGSISNNNVSLLNTGTTLLNAIRLECPNMPNMPVIPIMGNKVSAQNATGIQALNANIDVVKNTVNITDSKTAANAAVQLVASKGMVVLNDIFADKYYGLYLDNSNVNVAYNSIQAFGTFPAFGAIYTNSSIANVKRNQFVNSNNGLAAYITNPLNVNSDENNYWTAGANLIQVNTMLGLNITGLRTLTQKDASSVSLNPAFVSSNNNKLTSYLYELVFKQPITGINWGPTFKNTYETLTFDGRDRKGAYFIGAYNVFPKLEILKQTDELLACNGAEDLYIYVSGKGNLGAIPAYQWYKDGLLLAGETKAKVEFDEMNYDMSGTYKCELIIAGLEEPAWSNPIPVYILTTPEILDQPQEVTNAVIGGTYTFEVEAHYKGITPPLYKDKYQWYIHKASKALDIPLESDGFISGANTQTMVINNLQVDHFCAKGDYYFVKIESQCGEVFSEPFVISQKEEIVIATHPENIETCPTEDVTFELKATVSQGYNTDYQWMKDGAIIADDNVKYIGANTSKLQILDVEQTDEASYSCEVNIQGNTEKLESGKASLTLKDVPNAVSTDGKTDISIVRTNDLILSIDLLAGLEPINIKWSYKDIVMKEGEWDAINGAPLLKLTVPDIETGQSGQYICEVSNECDKVEIVFNVNVTIWDASDVVTLENGFALYSPMPNPVNSTLSIRFEMPKSQKAEIVLSDMSGKELDVIYSGLANFGENNINYNIGQLDLPSGMYFYTIRTEGFNTTKSFVITK